MTKRTEYDVDPERMTCTCEQFFHKRKCKHLAYALYRVMLYLGDRATYGKFIERERELARGLG